MPISGKNLKNLLWTQKADLWPWKLVCSIGYLSTTKFAQMMILGWPWPILRQGHIWSIMLLYGEKGKTVDFSETIVVCDVKVGRCSWLNESINLYEYQSRALICHFLGPKFCPSLNGKKYVFSPSSRWRIPNWPSPFGPRKFKWFWLQMGWKCSKQCNYFQQNRLQVWSLSLEQRAAAFQFLYSILFYCQNVIYFPFWEELVGWILGNTVASQHGAMLSNDIKALKTNR